MNENINEINEDNKIKSIFSDCMFDNVFDNNSDILFKMLKELFGKFEDENGTLLSIVGYESVPVICDDVLLSNDSVVKLSDNSYVYIRRWENICDNIIGEDFVQMIRVYDSENYYKITYDDLRKFWLTEEVLKLMDNGKPINNKAFYFINDDESKDFIYRFCNVNLSRCLDTLDNTDIDDVKKSVRWGAILCQNVIGKIEHLLGDDLLTEEEKERFLESIRESNECCSVYIGDKCIECAKRDGFCEGVEFGFEDGKEFATEEVIRNMIREGIDYSVISRVTKKAINEIECIRKEMLNEK